MQFKRDPQLIADFLTEASELIEQLDGDLVKLEHAQGSELVSLLNDAFRALHTIKGAASFLALDALTTFAHAAEDALNRLRQGDVAITAAIIDVLLKSADVVRGMIGELAKGQPLSPAPAVLIDQLCAIATGHAASPEASTSQSSQADTTNLIDLKLGVQKQDLLPFMAQDLHDTALKIESLLERWQDKASPHGLGRELAEHCANIVRTAEFFELRTLASLYQAMEKAAGNLESQSPEQLEELHVRLRAVCHLTHQQSQVLGQSRAYDWPCQTLLARMMALAQGQPLDEAIAGVHEDDIHKLLVLDGVLMAGAASSPAQPVRVATDVPVSNDEPAEAAVAIENDPAIAPAGEVVAPLPPAAVSRTNLSETTLRVEVDRLETLMNLAGQLVLSKNRILGLARQLRSGHSHELGQEFSDAASDLDRLTSELQMGVMRTRMQPLGKLFDRYPRVIRDVARMTGKAIDLQITGHETEVDKSVLELLVDPLVHLLRNSADHGLEDASTRQAAGKPQAGTIRILAQHQGSHVRVEVSDDGKGMDRQVIAAKAVEKGLVSADEVRRLSDEEVFRFIFAAGFSTAAKVTDMSGRGVGMDVVRTNVSRLGGVVTIQSAKGEGTTVEILIPLTVAVLPAMVVGVGEHLYALPLTSIVEIVRMNDESVHTIAGRPVMTLRELVLPLVDLHARLGEPSPGQKSRFAVVVAAGTQQAGLMVDRLIGQQEMVIKPLDDQYAAGGPFSGATIREDGDVSLILDIVQLLKQAPGHGPKNGPQDGAQDGAQHGSDRGSSKRSAA